MSGLFLRRNQAKRVTSRFIPPLYNLLDLLSFRSFFSPAFLFPRGIRTRAGDFVFLRCFGRKERFPRLLVRFFLPAFAGSVLQPCWPSSKRSRPFFFIPPFLFNAVVRPANYVSLRKCFLFTYIFLVHLLISFRSAVSVDGRAHVALPLPPLPDKLLEVLSFSQCLPGLFSAVPVPRRSLCAFFLVGRGSEGLFQGGFAVSRLLYP